jgi:O-antigen/teichoic acid export membrane protein
VISVLVNLYLPKATRLVTQNCTGEGLTDFVIGPGRVQAVLAIGIVAAFALFGKDFIALWIGEKYENAYYVALMLMIPATLPLVQNVCQSILDAQLRRLFSSVVLVVMAILNVMISVILVQPLGFWGAAVGTVVSLLVGHGLLMNIYYHKVIGLNVPRMFREIFAGILPAAVVSGLCCLPLVFLLDSSFLAFAVKCIVFVVLYAAALWLIGLNKTEKAMVKKMMKRKA